MSKFITKGLCVVGLLSMSLLQACNGDFYYSPGGWGYGGSWHRGGWHHGGGGRWGGGWGRGGWRRGGHGRWHMNAMSMGETAVSATPLNQETAAESLAYESGIRIESAKEILKFAQSDNLEQSLKDLGIDPQYMEPLKNMEMPSAEGIYMVASKLGEDPSRIETIFANFISDMKAQQ